MRNQATIRLAASACALASTLLSAQLQPARRSQTVQSAPPPTSQAIATQPQPVTPPRPLTPAELPAQPAAVTYANGLLTVTAHNSSLNQILRAISSQTHLKITGGVADERVFGSYGPEPAAQVLNSLLDGTSSNMLLVGSNGPAPAELILTPRGRGPTPPNPMAASFSQPNQNDEPPSRPSYDSSLSERSTPPHPPDAPEAPGQSTAQPSSPNEVKTPQDIFNQLMKLRQQHTQNNTNQQQ